MTTLPRGGTFSAFAMIVDINGFGKLAFSDFQGIAQFTSDVLIGGIYCVERNGGQVVGFMGDAFYAILHDPEKVFACCSEIAKDMASQYDDFASSQMTFPFSPKNIGLKIGVEYGVLDTAQIYSKFLDEQLIYTGRPVTYAARILTAGKGNRCLIGPEAYKQGVKKWIKERPRFIKGKEGETGYKYYVLNLDASWTN
ncbi:MAG: adenylate/guanylate cyclase domain-containing protein [Chitinophagaceae bacterium]